MVFTKAYEEVVNFIAAGTRPEKVIAFGPSEATQQRVNELLYKEKNESLTTEEKSEFGYG